MALLYNHFRSKGRLILTGARLGKSWHQNGLGHSGSRFESVWTEIKPEMRINPNLTMVDEGLRIEASGLVPGHPATIRAEMETHCGRRRFVSFGCYLADDAGCISTLHQPSLGGTYCGIEPLGPLWSMRQLSHINYTADDQGSDHGHEGDDEPDSPVTISFDLLNGHVGWGETRSDVLVDGGEIHRHFMAGNIERTSIQCGPAQATVFTPMDRGSKPLPAIVDFRGADDQKGNHLAALLASHGFVAMTIPFPRIDTDSDSDTYLDINCFKELVHKLASHEMVDKKRIGAFSRGDGVAVALGLAAHFDHDQLPIRCLVGVNGVGFNTAFGWVLPDGTRTGHFPYYVKVRDLKSIDGVVRPCSQLSDLCRVDTAIHGFVPVANIGIPMLMFTAQDNPYLPSATSMRRLKRKLEKEGRHAQMKLVEYSGAGHHLDPTNIMHTPESRGSIPNVTDDKVMRWGGETTSHMQAQADMWQRALTFLRKMI